MVFKVIVAGGRDFTNYSMLKGGLDFFFHKKIAEGYEIEIVSGCAKGADRLGEHYSKVVFNKEATKFPAPWDDIEGKPEHEIGYTKNGKPYWKVAGHVRNSQMADYADAAIVFWDGKSTGSANMIKQAKAKGLKVRKFIYIKK